MSHTLVMTAADQAAGGRPVFLSQPALFMAVFKLKLPEPAWQEDVNLGDNDQVPLWATGWEIKLQDWHKPCYVNTDTGSVFFNNWAIYDAQHPEVRAGKRRIGEGGRWGDFQRMLELEAQYEEAANELALAAVYGQAQLDGAMVQEVGRSPGRIELELTTA